MSSPRLACCRRVSPDSLRTSGPTTNTTNFAHARLDLKTVVARVVIGMRFPECQAGVDQFRHELVGCRRVGFQRRWRDSCPIAVRTRPGERRRRQPPTALQCRLSRIAPHHHSTPALEKTKVTLIALALILLTDIATLAQSRAPTIRGTWAATAGPNQVLQGTWTAELTVANPDNAQGSWTLLNRSNQIAAQGTWAAVKTARVWSGTWSARVATPGRGPGRVLSGSWRTQVADADMRSLSELLQKTLREQVSGTWASGRLAGSWSLRASQ